MRKISLMLFIALAVMFTACKKNETTVDVPFKYTHIDSLIMNANQGDADAQVELAMCFDTGKGVKQNKYDALGWYKEASEQGSKEAIEFLNGFYKNARIAADKGDKEAQRNMGSCYANGYGVEKDTIEAMNWFRKAAEQGHAEAQRVLGACYVTGYGVEKDTIEAMNWFRKAADQGDANAQNYIGACYAVGNVVKLDYAEAAKWYRKAADQGYADAQNRLGRCYENGNGVKLDYAEAAKWYRKAADQGYADAQNNLGRCYAKGNGVKQDYAEAAKWFRKAADQGNEWAQRLLGLLYEEGEGVKQDYTEAAKWYRKAAEQGDSRAQKLLGDLYAQGTGVKQDYAEAAKWYRKAADKGNAIAQTKLGLCYATGKGVEQNINEAAHLIFKGLKDWFGLTKLCVFFLILLLISIIITLFIYKKYRKEGFKKSQAVIISFISWLRLIILILFFAMPIGFLGGLTGLSLLDLGDFLKMTCVPLTLIIVSTFIIIILKTKWIISSKTNSISAEGENETLEDTLMDGKKGHKVKFNIVTFQILSFAALALAILVGIPYYWFVTKALGHEPLSRLTGLMSSAFIEVEAYIINLLIFLLALILGLVAMPLLHRLVWGWRNTSYRMDWKIMVLWTYCNKLLKKSQYIKGVIAPFFVLGLLPLLISPFINSIGMCLFGIVFISSTAPNFMYIWKLRKEPRDCMIMDIKGEHACFVLDEDQPADNE